MHRWKPMRSAQTQVRNVPLHFNMVPSDPFKSRLSTQLIFCRGVLDFATDCPCGVWCRGLITCLLHVGPPFGNRLKQQLGCRFDIMDNISSHVLHFDICRCICLDAPYHFRFISTSFMMVFILIKYSRTYSFNRRSLYTFYQDTACIFKGVSRTQFIHRTWRKYYNNTIKFPLTDVSYVNNRCSYNSRV